MTSQMKPMIKLTDLIQPHFYAFWKTKRPYQILFGGRGSFKSSTTALKLVYKMKRHAQAGHRANVIVIRENAVNLRDSVYNQIIWAIDKLNMTAEFDTGTSPMVITHIASGSRFYFYGADKPEKLKSNTVQDVIAVWYEEAANLKGPEVFDQANPTFIRQKSEYVDFVEIIHTYNPPKNPYDWINEWLDGLRGDPDYFLDESSYLDDKLGFTTEQQLKLIERYRLNDPNYYDWLYLGKQIGLGTNIYNMQLFRRVDKVPADDPVELLLTSVDPGHMQSATACSVYGVTAKGNVYVLDTYYYSPMHEKDKKPPSILVHELHDFLQRVADEYHISGYRNRTIDSAEGAIRNEYWYEYHTRWNPVKKKKEKDMIDMPQDLLAQGRVFILNVPGNDVFIAEHQKYQWDEKTIHTNDPKVVKVDDHTCDEFKYFVNDNARLLGLIS